MGARERKSSRELSFGVAVSATFMHVGSMYISYRKLDSRGPGFTVWSRRAVDIVQYGQTDTQYIQAGNRADLILEILETRRERRRLRSRINSIIHSLCSTSVEKQASGRPRFSRNNNNNTSPCLPFQTGQPASPLQAACYHPSPAQRSILVESNHTHLSTEETSKTSATRKTRPQLNIIITWLSPVLTHIRSHTTLPQHLYTLP